MQKRKLGGLEAPAIGLGCMGMSGIYGAGDDAESIRTIHRALELSVTLFDTADMYGRGHNERLLGRALRGRREQAIVATKFGMVADATGSYSGIDGSPAYVKRACEASLERLGIDSIDLYQQHRVDPKVPIEETVGAMYDLVTAGKVRFLGLSEAQPDDLRRAASVAPIATLQTEYSLFERHAEPEVLGTCADLGIGFLAYAPLGRGLLTGRFRSRGDFSDGDYRVSSRHPRFAAETMPHNSAPVDVVEAIAEEHDATAAQVALAWLLNQREWVVPIPGSKHVQHVEQNAAAPDLRLSLADLARLDALVPAGGSIPGERYPGGRTPSWRSAPIGANRER